MSRGYRPPSTSGPSINWWRLGPTLLLLVLLLACGIIAARRATAPKPLLPADYGSYTFPFRNDAQKASFLRGSASVTDGSQLYSPKTQIGLKTAFTVMFPPQAFSATHPLAFNWKGFTFVPAVVVAPDPGVVSTVSKSLANGDDQSLYSNHVIMLGFRDADGLDPQTKYANIVGLYYWTSSRMDAQNPTGADLPVILVGDAQAVGESQVTIPTVSSVASQTALRRGDLTISVDRLEFAASQTRVHLTVQNDGGAAVDLGLTPDNTYLTADGKFQPLSVTAEGESPADDVLSGSLPPATSAGYLVFPQISQPKELALTVPDPAGNGTFEVHFDLGKLQRASVPGARS